MDFTKMLKGLIAFCLILSSFKCMALEKKSRTLLITGCARSGTGFVSAFLQKNGLEVGHEYDRSFGIVAWPMAVDADFSPWSPPSNQFSFEHIFHQVRHPLKTIASASNEPIESWLYIQRYIPELHLNDPKIVKGAKYWYYWNLLAEKKAEWTYQIEEIETHVAEMSERLGIVLDPFLIKNIPTNTNTRNYQDVYSWKDLKEALDSTLYQNIIELALRYGYTVNE